MSLGSPSHNIRHLRRWWRWHLPRVNVGWAGARLHHTLHCRSYQWTPGGKAGSTACDQCGTWRWFPILLPIKGTD